MSWKEAFEKGVVDFKSGQLHSALLHMDQAAQLQKDNYRIHDSRAAIYEKLGNFKAALMDSKRAIDLAPDRWQGYARAARVFSALHKHEATVKMVDYALSRLPQQDQPASERRRPLVELREKSLRAQAGPTPKGHPHKQQGQQEHTAQTASAVGKLPVEMLVAVFSVLVDDDPCRVIGLSHVCGHWRKVVVGTPALWRTLVLSNRHPLRKAKLWMERSRSFISALTLRAELPTLEYRDVLDQLRWDRLETLSVHGTIISEVLLLVRTAGSFPKLKQVLLDSCGHLPGIFMLDYGWALRELSILGETSFVQYSHYKFNLLRILRIRVSATCANLSVFCPLSMIKDTPLLEDLVLEFSAPMGIHHEVNILPLDMMHLASVELRNVENPSALLSRINAPSLKHLTVFGAASRVDEGLLHIICDGRDSSLVSLRIGSCALKADTLVTLFPRTPRLETLQIYGVEDVVNRALQFLAGGKPSDALTGAPSLCPCLKDVDVSRCSDLSTSSVYALVKRRLQIDQAGDGCCRIESLRTDGCPKMDADMLPWFRSKVERFSCVYMTKKEARRWR